MQKWEYKMILLKKGEDGWELGDTTAKFYEHLDRLGSNGWELVTVVPDDWIKSEYLEEWIVFSYRLVFKRAIVEG